MENEFEERVGQALLSLPQDLKAALRVVEDADLDDESRVLIAGAVIHVLSGANVIPGMRGVLAHVGSAVMLRSALSAAKVKNPEAMAAHAEEAPELVGELDAFEAAAKNFLGEGYLAIDKALAAGPKLTFQGQNAKKCVHDMDASRWLYDAVNEAIVERLELDEDEVARELKKVDAIVAPLRMKASS